MKTVTLPRLPILALLCGIAAMMPVQVKKTTGTQQLQQSAWFSDVCTRIEQDLYHFYRSAENDSLQSENRRQGLQGAYSWERMSLAPVHSSAGTDSSNTTSGPDWNVSLRLRDICFDGAIGYRPTKKAVIYQRDSSLVFDHNGAFTVEYLNTTAGIRQNFIIKQAPRGAEHTRQVSVRMALDAGLRAYTSGDGELHFARPNAAGGGLTTELLYTGLKAWDATGRLLEAKLDAGNEGREVYINVQATDAVYPLTIDPLSTTAAGTLNGAASGNNFSYSVAPAGDVNGDGYSDVIVGTLGANKAYVYHGGASGLSTTAAWTVSSTSSNFGCSVAGAGDVNGDGYSDVIVGANSANKAFVYFGSASGLAATAAWTVTGANNFGGSVSGAGDVNADGYSDILVGASGGNKVYGYYGSATGPAATASWTSPTGSGSYGWSVAPAGDVNSDGYSDVIIGANSANRAYVYYGSSTGLSAAAVTILTGTAGLFGNSVACAGDVNGDGYADVIVGSSGGNNAFVYHGGAGGISTTSAWTITSAGGSLYGNSVSGAGDVNGDGFADVVVGAYGANKSYVYFGSTTGLSATAAWTGTGATGNNYGYCVAPAGDVNGDGFSDVIIGATGISSNAGAAYIYTGSAAGALTTAGWTVTGATAEKGFNVACAGDVNADGYSDVLVGVSGVPFPLGGTAFAGGAYLYKGSATGLSTVASWHITGTTSSNYGSVAGAGDVNGDGYSDVIVGASGANTYTGAAYLYYGNSTGLSTTAAWTGAGPSTYSNYGYSVGSAGDVNGDGYSDIIVGTYAVGGNAGAAYVYYGRSSAPATTASWSSTGAAGSYYGASVAGVGDVNGDGFTDVMVGAPGTGNYNGTAYLYYGRAVGLATTAAWTKSGTVSSLLGISVAAAGDINGDGFSDVVIGAAGLPGGGVAGAAFVYNGGAAGLGTGASWSFTTAATNTEYGWSVASAGDVNGDGYSEIIVGAYGAGSNAGAAYMYYGSPTGVSATASWTVTGAANSYFGGSVASAGDVDGDGYGDVMTGPYGAASSAASATLYSGNANASNDAGSVQLWNTNLTTPLSAANMSAQTFGASMRPVSFIGRINGKLVWDVQKNGLSFSKPGTAITNSAVTNGAQSAWTSITGGIGAGIIKTAVLKASGKQNKIRMRLRYSLITAVTGQVYGPWKYSASYMAGVEAQMALPQTLTRFDGSLINNGRLLQWHTAQEEPGTSFDVERSTGGSFTTIAGIPANGSAIGAGYTFTDAQALPGVSIVYYRLKLTAADGSFHYSAVISLRPGGSIARLQLINTCVTGTALLRYTAEQPGSLRLCVLALSGQVLLQQNLPAVKGINSYTLDVQRLPKGFYLLQGAEEAVRFVRQ